MLVLLFKIMIISFVLFVTVDQSKQLVIFQTI